MKVTIEVTSWFKRFTGGRTQMELEILEGTSALDAAADTGIPKDEIGFITVCTGTGDECLLVKDEYTVKDGDILRVYPMLIGG
ncbi:MAG: hypothetical protein N2645_03280 [Clostridia bacterium]|nr:hypothetical protein [Clostridia bacterium]